VCSSDLPRRALREGAHLGIDVAREPERRRPRHAQSLDARVQLAWSPSLGFARHVDPEVRALAERAARRFRELGCRVEEAKLAWPSPQPAWEAVFCGGIAARLAPHIAERRADIDPGLAALIDRTLAWGPTEYVERWFDRIAWAEHPRRLFERCDLLLTPTTACAPFPVGIDNPAEVAGGAVAPYEWTPFTFPFNATGHPAASVPCGFTRDGLPVGLQIVGRRFADATVLRAAAAFERLAPWASARPAV